MTYTLAMNAADEALIARYAARENLSVPDFMLRTTLRAIEGHVHVPRPKARDEMTDEEFDTMIAQSMEEIRMGKGVPFERAFDEIMEELDLDKV